MGAPILNIRVSRLLKAMLIQLEFVVGVPMR